MRVVISLTTLPDRYENLKDTLNSLHNQIVKSDCIYLTLPYVAKRSGKTYPELPTDLCQLCTVVRCEVDYGPICKIYGALVSEHDPNTIIITVDDDVIYPTNFIKLMVEKSMIKPRAAVTGTGILLHDGYMSINTNFNKIQLLNGFLCGFPINKYRKVDIVQGVSGVLYKRWFFPKDKLYEKLFHYAMEDDDLFKSDDILISSYLCSKNIKRYIFEKMPLVDVNISSPDALSHNLVGMLNVFKNAVNKCKKLGLLKKIEKSSIIYSPHFKVNFWIIITLFLAILLGVYISFKYQIY